MTARKLQSEIDKILKKVTEGVQTFEEIYDAIQDSNAPPNKEKLEAELKKEIKKLQRFRDQIKTWIGSNEIKDKRQLIENRKLIETQMEKFKACEKELKTKPFSKEGIQLAARVDPQEKEKEELYHWINDVTDRLNAQIDRCEAEMETLQASGKKSRKTDGAKADHLETLEHAVESHKFHIGRLEAVMRLLENESLSTETVRDIQDSVEYYVESNQDPDFQEDDTIYDDLNLEDAEAFGLPVNDDDAGDVETPAAASPAHQGSGGHRRSTSENASKDASTADRETASATKTVKHAGLPTGFQKLRDDAPAAKGTGGGSAAALGGKDRRQSGGASAGASGGASAATAGPQGRGTGTRGGSSTSKTAAVAAVDEVASSAAALTTPAAPAAPTQRWASAAAAAAASSSPPPVAAVSTSSSTEEKRGSGRNNGPAKPPGLGRRGNATVAVPAAATEQPPAAAASPAPSPVPAQPQQNPSRRRVASNDAEASAQPQSGGSRLPPSLVDLVASFEATKERSRRDTAFLQAMTEASFRHMPDLHDAERIRHFVPADPYPTPSYYPQLPLSAFENPALFEKFDIDTLFFIFYYHSDSYQRYLAARELKRQSWRFHKKYLTWFQRHEEPKLITDEYEQGTYIYFDYEGAWCQRKKTEFRFEYRYLEDEEL